MSITIDIKKWTAFYYLTHFSDVKEWERISNKYWYFLKVCSFGYQEENKKYFRNCYCKYMRHTPVST